MRVGMIMETSFPPDARVEHEARTLLEAGHEVSLFCIEYGSAQRHRSGPAGKFLFGDPISFGAGPIPGDVEFEREICNGVSVWRIHAGSVLYKSSALVYSAPFFQIWMTPAIRDFIRRSQVDILHVHDMVIAEAAMNANKPFGLPVILDLHENRPEIMKQYAHVKSAPGKWLIRLERWREKQRELMHRADHVILVTEAARYVAKRRDNLPMEKSTALPNVVWPGAFDGVRVPDGLKIKTTGRYNIVYVGDTSLRRGTLNALKSVARLRNRIPGLRFWIIGSSSEDALLNAFIQQQDLEEVVMMEGWQKPDRIPEYLAACDLCLSPLSRNLHHDTTYANKLFQYMAAGRAVVVSDCPAQADVVRAEKCGLVHRASNTADLASKILYLANEETLRREMGNRGAQAVRERWNWGVTGHRLLKVYDEYS